MEKIVKFPKITHHVEDTEYRRSAVGENLKTVSSEQVANTRVQPTVKPVEVKQPKIFKTTTQRKHSPGQERSEVNKNVSRRCSEGQDHQDERTVNENPIIQEKSQPSEQANRNSPVSRSLRSSSWAYQAPVVAQRQVPTDQTVQKNVGSRGKCRRCGFRTYCTKTSSSTSES